MPIAMNAIQFNLARIVGPTIGGLAYTKLGATWCFALNGVSFIAVIISLYMIKVKFVPPKSSERIWTSMKEGFQFIRQREGLEPLVALAFLMTLLGFTLVGFLPVFVQDVFNKGPGDVSITVDLFGRRLGNGRIDRGGRAASLKQQGRAVLLIMTGLGVLISSFALSRWLPLSCVLIFASGMATMGSASLMLTTVQLIGGRRDAGARDERLQCRVSGRHADGRPGAGEADSDIWRFTDGGGRRIGAGGRCAVFSARPAPHHGAVKKWSSAASRRCKEMVQRRIPAL